jgi:hypothetical protein
MLYKHTTQKLYICDPQTQLKQLLYSSKNFTTCFGPYGPSSGDIFEDFLLYCDTSIIDSDSYDEKIIILERANFICILYEFYMHFV